MNENTTTPRPLNEGATVVITHRVRERMRADYERWLAEIGPLCRASPGVLDWHIVRPIPGLTGTYTVIIRFDTESHLHAWMASPTRARLIEKAQPMLVTGDDFFVNSGLDFWFAPDGAKTRVPVRWKQFLATWSVIFPLVLGVPWVLMELLHRLGLPDNRFFTTFLATGIIVSVMVYIVMPRYTRLLRRWLFD